ncbi:MAG TPA: hypothetical protein PKD37_03360 [Oligoflexia bacterium]|nr:hypothetical protein [Oligoflexia bacterium]HMP27007.1 hypothetical protein [Oligoflexia bacterium]
MRSATTQITSSFNLAQITSKLELLLEANHQQPLFKIGSDTVTIEKKADLYIIKNGPETYFIPTKESTRGQEPYYIQEAPNITITAILKNAPEQTAKLSSLLDRLERATITIKLP